MPKSHSSHRTCAISLCQPAFYTQPAWHISFILHIIKYYCNICNPRLSQHRFGLRVPTLPSLLTSHAASYGMLELILSTRPYSRGGIVLKYCNMVLVVTHLKAWIWCQWNEQAYCKIILTTSRNMLVWADTIEGGEAMSAEDLCIEHAWTFSLGHYNGFG